MFQSTKISLSTMSSLKHGNVSEKQQYRRRVSDKVQLFLRRQVRRVRHVQVFRIIVHALIEPVQQKSDLKNTPILWIRVLQKQ